MLCRKLWRWSIAAVMLSPLASVAESNYARAVIPWSGDGRVYQISESNMLFLGELEGIIYVQTGEGKFDEGFVSCPVTQKIEMGSGKSIATGYCTIVINQEDSVFAEWKCEGETGQCEGEIVFTGGVGRYKGISGSSDILVRSPIQALAKNLANDSVLRAGSGIMILSDIKYELAAQ